MNSFVYGLVLLIVAFIYIRDNFGSNSSYSAVSGSQRSVHQSMDESAEFPNEKSTGRYIVNTYSRT